jgi:hypothetical protein
LGPLGAPGSGAPGGGMDQMARQAQGAQPTPLSNAKVQAVNILGNQRAPLAPGGRLPPIQGGPG